MKVYFLSGIAADRRLFKYVSLPNGFEPSFLDWIPPLKKESLHDYAVRICGQIPNEKPFVIIGLSLGGIVATEIANLKKPVATIIISSVTRSSELPGYYKWINKIRLHKIVPAAAYKTSALLKRLFTREKLSDKKIIGKMILQTDSRFIKWGIDATLNWQNQIVPTPLWHIHGTRDEVFPIHYANPTHIIPKGGHLLVLTHPYEINNILAKVLQNNLQ